MTDETKVFPNSQDAGPMKCPSCGSADGTVGDDGLTTCPSCDLSFQVIYDTTDFAAETRGESPAPSGSGPRRERSMRMGDFELLERVGAGAFGEVWKARDAKLDRVVALKLPRPGTGADEGDFLKEAQLAAQLKHPHVVAVHLVGAHDDQTFIVTEFIEGQTLQDWLALNRPGPRVSAQIAIAIASGLHAAHELNIVHRDLKPGNVMLDKDLQPHVMDFGLARRDLANVTVSMDGRIMGTPAYMSPEQARGDSNTADARSDVYSLGVVLFEMLTGELPFRGNIRNLLAQVISNDPPAPRTLNSHVPKDLETITLRCLEKEPRRRFSSAREAADELQRYLDGVPILSRPITRTERALRWCRRNPLATTIAALAAFIVLALPVAVIRESTLRSRAEDLLTNNTQLLKKERATSAQLQQTNGELQSTIAALDTANTSLAGKVAESYARQGDMAAQRGQLRESIRLYDEALQAGHEATAELRLRRVEAYLGLMDLKAARTELKQLESMTLVAGEKSRMLLFQGNLDSSGSGGKELIRAAIEEGLPPGYDSLAKAVLAEDLQEVARHSQEATEQLPFNATAHRLHLGTLVIQGRLREFQRRGEAFQVLFPDDRTVDLVSMLLIDDPDPVLKEKRLARIGQTLAPKQLETIKKLAEVTEGVKHVNMTAKNQLAAAATLIAKLSSLYRIAAELRNDEGIASMFHGIRFPGGDSIVSTMMSAYRHLLFGNDLKAAATLEPLVRSTNIAEFQFMYGMCLQRGGSLEEDKAKRAAVMLEADRALQQVANAEFSLSGIHHQQAFIHYVIALVRLGRTVSLPQGDERSEADRQLVETLRAVRDALIDNPDSARIGADELERLTWLATRPDTLDLATFFVTRWQELQPKSAESWFFRSQIAVLDRSFAKAHQCLVRTLAIDPKHRGALALQNQLLPALAVMHQQLSELSLPKVKLLPPLEELPTS